jgi:hypothetical protein
MYGEEFAGWLSLDAFASWHSLLSTRLSSLFCEYAYRFEVNDKLSAR